MTITGLGFLYRFLSSGRHYGTDQQARQTARLGALLARSERALTHTCLSTWAARAARHARAARAGAAAAWKRCGSSPGCFHSSCRGCATVWQRHGRDMSCCV